MRLAREALYEGLVTSAVSEVETRLKRRDGTVFDGVVRVTALDPSDPGKGVIAAITDVSERKRAEEALRESEERVSSNVRQCRGGDRSGGRRWTIHRSQ